ncbi:c-type cytochrome [Bacillaceae bacterium W0354]
MKKKVLAAIFGFMLVLAACGGGDDDAGGGGDTAGEKLYANNCAVCHGGDLQGGAGPKLKGISSKHDAAEIKDIILNGYGGMKPVNVSEEDAQTIADWVVEQ